MESEARFRMMAEGSPFLIAVGDASSNATYFNKAWVELTGRPIQQLLEFGWVDIVHPDDRDRYVNIYLEAFKVRGPFTGEFRVLNPYGQYQWLLAHGVPRISSNGVFEGYISACADITQQKLNELQLREKEAALANAIELAELGTWKLEASTGMMTLSLRYAEMYGFKESIVSLERALSVVVESDRIETAQKFESAMQLGSNGKIDAEYKINNSITGNSHVIHVLGQAFFDEAGNYSRMEGTAQDVTVQRELQLALENEVQLRTEELQATNEELATSNEELSESSQLLMRSNDELSQFAHIASHDLQEPVRKISVFVEMLSKALPTMDDRSKSYLEKIDLSANRMLNLIRDVLTNSQISNTTSKFQSVDLNKVLANTVSDLEMLIQNGHCKIISEKLPVIDAIPVQMGQLFSNLISNAMKFAKAGTPLHLDIRAEILDSTEKAKFANLQQRKVYYRLSFTDNGIGFDQLYASKIFEIFQRLHNKNEYTGTGIGLATCKKIVLNHGGEIAAFSTPGNGATFYVVLPATNF